MWSTPWRILQMLKLHKRHQRDIDDILISFIPPSISLFGPFVSEKFPPRGRCPQAKSNMFAFLRPSPFVTATPRRSINIHPAHVCPGSEEKRPISLNTQSWNNSLIPPALPPRWRKECLSFSFFFLRTELYGKICRKESLGLRQVHTHLDGHTHPQWKVLTEPRSWPLHWKLGSEMQGQALRTFPSFLLAAVPLSKAWPPCAKFWFVGMTTYKSDLSTGMFYSIEEWLGTVSLLLFLFFSLSVLPHPPPPPLISDLSLPPSFSLSLSLGVITTRPISTWSLIIHTRSFLSTLLSSPPLCSPISVLIYHSWQGGGGDGGGE